MFVITLTLDSVVVGSYVSDSTKKQIVRDLMYGIIDEVDLVDEKILFDEYTIEEYSDATDEWEAYTATNLDNCLAGGTSTWAVCPHCNNELPFGLDSKNYCTFCGKELP